MTRRTVIICDIDNCIANDAWRIPSINWAKQGDPRYHDYHSLSGFDTFEPFALDCTPADRIVFMTARPTHYQALTEHWLKRVAGVAEFDLLMRPDGHRDTSPQIKEMQLGWLLEPSLMYDVQLSDIVAAHDDHQGVIDMYLKHGLPAKRIAIHNVNAFYDPLRNIAVA